MVCPCRYPLIFVDNRDDDEIEYISVPSEVMEDDGGVDYPEFEEVEEEGFDGKYHRYMSVLWKDPKNAVTKRYDVANHIVVAGCEVRTDGKKIQCRKKELYVVLHPIDEWEQHHKIKIK